MIVNCSPDAMSSGETLCSLRFASQVNQCELGKPKKMAKTMSAEQSIMNDDETSCTNSGPTASAAIVVPIINPVNNTRKVPVLKTSTSSGSISRR